MVRPTPAFLKLPGGHFEPDESLLGCCSVHHGMFSSVPSPHALCARRRFLPFSHHTCLQIVSSVRWSQSCLGHYPSNRSCLWHCWRAPPEPVRREQWIHEASVGIVVVGGGLLVLFGLGLWGRIPNQTPCVDAQEGVIANSLNIQLPVFVCVTPLNKDGIFLIGGRWGGLSRAPQTSGLDLEIWSVLGKKYESWIYFLSNSEFFQRLDAALWKEPRSLLIGLWMLAPHLLASSRRFSKVIITLPVVKYFKIIPIYLHLPSVNELFCQLPQR